MSLLSFSRLETVVRSRMSSALGVPRLANFKHHKATSKDMRDNLERRAASVSKKDKNVRLEEEWNED